MDVEFLRYQFSDGYTGVISKQRFKVGIRHVQILYMFVGAIVIGLVRGSIGVAVLALNDEDRRHDTYLEIHNWDKRIQGAVMSSFFFGYAVMLVPADLLLRKIGGKIVCTAIFVVNGALCVAMPTIVNKGGWVAASNAQLFMGMAHSCFSTVYETLIERWLPPNERNTYSHFIYGGIQLGIIIGLPISGLLSQTRLGWEFIYYALAMATLSMAVVIGTLTASSFEGHQAMGDGEKEFIRDAMTLYKKKKLIRPFRSILECKKFWAVTVAHSASNALFIFYLIFVPVFLETLNVSLKDATFYTMMSFLTMWLVYLTTSPTVEWVAGSEIVNYIMSTTCLRKIINTLGALGIIIGLSILPNLTQERTNVAVIVLIAILGLLGFQLTGFLSNYQDMTENYSGTLIMLSSTISGFVGAVIPFLFSFFLYTEPIHLSQWKAAFYILAAYYMGCNAVYVLFASNKRQPWDGNSGRKTGHYNHSYSYDSNHIQLEEFSHSKLIQEENGAMI
ncbi:putative inorganic phosphate cotransporter isoform X2 [Bombyx mori]|uniref:Major facilitator superfamily (MFS) profile domain-containing protein n=1 Tax=Bombyx mori TaxID=7091 RepID=A0A8R2GA83_BOMMO|nr:putative inorganic phosphate cotransporter [Bombyx mori]